MAETALEEWERESAARQRRWALVGAIAAGVGVAFGVLVYVIVVFNGVPAGDDRVMNALNGAALRDAKLGSVDMAACAEGESSRHFTAINMHGSRVEGTVCCGLTGVAKGCTIRWDR
jgi:hypothetical protein